jgi:signal transduction histidine kinase
MLERMRWMPLEKIPGRGWSLAQLGLAVLLLPALPFYDRQSVVRESFEVLAAVSLFLGFAGQSRLVWSGLQERSSWSLAASGILLGLGGAMVRQILELALEAPLMGKAWDALFFVAFLMCALGIVFLPRMPEGKEGFRSRLRFQLDYFTHVVGVAYLQLTVVILPLLRQWRESPSLWNAWDLSRPLLALFLSLATADAVVRKRQVGRQELALRLLAMASVVNLMGDTCFNVLSRHDDPILFGFRHWLLILVSLGTSSSAWILSEKIGVEESFARRSFLSELIFPQAMLVIPLIFIGIFWAAGVVPGTTVAMALFLMLLSVIVRIVVFAVDAQKDLQQKEQAIADLRSAQFHMVENGKLSALGSLVAGVAHELNTPLGNALTATTNIAAQLSVFRQRLVGKQLPRANLEKFLENLDQGTAILTTSLERSAELVRSFKQVRVEPTLEPSGIIPVRLFLEQFTRILASTMHLGGHVLEIECDATLKAILPKMTLTQILDQLLRNAQSHGFADRERGTIWLCAWPQASSLCLDVRDDGIGMDAATLAHLYEPFFTTRRNMGNLGLGAHFVHSLVTQRLGGKIEAHSRLGEGTTISIEIPGVVLNG